ncbi:MAG: SH3 domain-containing protein [Gallionellaceae bacterium]|nr:SH3 domain-containing protein [Gallionellaceae bacterium]
MKAWLFLLLLPSLALAMGTPPQKPVAAAPGNPGIMLRDDALKTSPSSAADAVAKLGRGDKVRVLTSNGGWTQVYAAGKTGWVRILSVKSEIAATPDLGALVEAGNRPRDPGRVVAVAGARGLDEVELKAARFNPDELVLLDTYVASRSDAEQFAQLASLTRRDVPYLPAPESASQSSMSKQP